MEGCSQDLTQYRSLLNTFPISLLSAELFLLSFFQELEDHLQEEQNKVNHLNKVKAKLEQQLDEVCDFENDGQLKKWHIKSGKLGICLDQFRFNSLYVQRCYMVLVLILLLYFTNI